jgi:hypothetical protein
MCAGYITRDGLLRDHLRKQQARISQVILDAAGDATGTKWLCRSRQEDATPSAALRAAA